MDFPKARRSYLILLQQYRSGSLSHEAFSNEVRRIRVQDDSGYWWQLQENGAGWLVWNGQAWQPATAPHDTPSAQSKQDIRSLGSLFLYFMRIMWQILLTRWKLFVVAMVIVWAVNIYFMLGYRIPWWGAVSQFTADLMGANAELLPRIALWLLLPLFIYSLLHKFRKDKPIGFFRKVAQVPQIMAASFTRISPRQLALILGAAALMLLFLQVMNSRLIGLLMLLSFLVSLSDQDQSFFCLLFRLTVSDVRRLVGSPAQAINKINAFRLQTALVGGALFYLLFSFIHINLGYYAVLPLVLAAIVLVFIKTTPSH
ncbi:MAG: hypothetical protein SCM11_15090 [Bacillota bacterium]|nr:hypothetical protein [Bacillota bacterium]